MNPELSARDRFEVPKQGIYLRDAGGSTAINVARDSMALTNPVPNALTSQSLRPKSR